MTPKRFYARAALSSLAFLLTLLITACGDSPTATSLSPKPTVGAATSAASVTTAAATTNAATSAPATKWSLASAAAPYKGQKVTLATVSWKDATVELAKEFTQITGIELEVVQYPHAELLEKTMADAKNNGGAYDIVAHTYMTPYAQPGYIIPLDTLLGNPALVDPDYNLKDTLNIDFYTKYFYTNGANIDVKTVALPFGAAVMALFYRKDLFENPQYQASFKTQYGYDLKPPADWKQLLDISKFFTETDWKSPGGEKGYGIAASGKKEFSMTYMFQLYYSSLVALKDNSKLSLLDRKLRPTFNNELGEEALNNWKKSLEYAPPDVFQSGNTETRDIFAKGNTAMLLTFDSAISNMLSSPIKDKWGLSSIPGRSVLGGWMLSLSKASKNKEAAFLAMQFLTSAKADQYLFDKAGRYPGRTSTYASDNYKAKNPYWEVLAKIKDNGVPQIDVENAKIDPLLSEELTLFLTGKKPAKDTLEAMSSGMTKILQEGGWFDRS